MGFVTKILFASLSVNTVVISDELIGPITACWYLISCVWLLTWTKTAPVTAPDLLNSAVPVPTPLAFDIFHVISPLSKSVPLR